MFNFLKKLKKKNEKAKVQEVATKKTTTSKKNSNPAREKHIAAVMEATGWTRKKTVDTIKEAKARLGISYGDYSRNAFYNIPIEEQKAKYDEILERKERRRINTEKKNEKSIAGVMAATGWDHDYTEAKILEARERTGCTYKEYLIYKFYELTPEEQDKVFVAKYSRKITAKYDVNKEFADMLYNKEATNVYFSKYLRRPWCVNTKITLDEFKEKFSDSKRVIYKPLGGNRGRGVEAFDIDSENAETVYNTLATYPAGVVEQYVVQHPAVSSINPDSVNTLRIVTISSNTQPVTAEGKMKDFAYAALRIGGSGSIVDNFHSGGMVAAIDLETGELVTDAADGDGRVFEKHPATGTVIKGFKIPYFKEALELVDEAITEKKIEGYLGWDIAITENGPVLIEVNVIPGVVLLSMPYVAEKKGMKYVMEKYM